MHLRPTTARSNENVVMPIVLAKPRPPAGLVESLPLDSHFKRQVYHHISILRFLYGLPLHFGTQLSLTKVTKSDQYPPA